MMHTYFHPLEKTDIISINSKLSISVENIIDFTINSKIYKINNFKSVTDAFLFLENNRNDITHIIWENNDRYQSDRYEIFLSNQKLHNLKNCAMIYQHYFVMGFDKNLSNLSEEEKLYYINGENILEKDFKFKLRIYKLNRLLYET